MMNGCLWILPLLDRSWRASASWGNILDFTKYFLLKILSYSYFCAIYVDNLSTIEKLAFHTSNTLFNVVGVEAFLSRNGAFAELHVLPPSSLHAADPCLGRTSEAPHNLPGQPPIYTSTYPSSGCKIHLGP